MPHQFSTSYTQDTLALFAQYKKWGERAMAQVADTDLTRAIDPESNSIATIVKHMAGNMRSRWTDFLTSDGEKPDRNRDTEFETPPATREELNRMWETGWALVFAALAPLTDADLSRTVFIRGEAHSVMQAINRQVAHYSSHTGQIIFLAKHLASSHWQTLTVARGKSAEFNRRVAVGEASRR